MLELGKWLERHIFQGMLLISREGATCSAPASLLCRAKLPEISLLLVLPCLSP